MTDEELQRLPILKWMPSRIPQQDALTALVPAGVKFPEEKLPPGVSRWYPQEDGGLRLRVLHQAGHAFDRGIFEIEPGGWDHTTCDVCIKHNPPMTLCYVTRFDPYIELCADCYRAHVVKPRGVRSLAIWDAKRLIGIDGPL